MGHRPVRVLSALLLALILGAGAAVLASELRCDQCGAKIEGRYVQTASGTYCSDECYQATLPRCADCGRRMERYYDTGRDRLLCPDCYEETRPRCERCQVGLTAWIEVRGHRFCTPCSRLERCSVCNLPLPGLEYPDGRFICDRCHESAVLTQAAGQRLFDEVRRRLRHELGLATGHPITFELVNRSLLNQRGGKTQAELGLFRYESERHQTTSIVRDIWGREFERSLVSERVEERRYVDILYGLPRGRFIQVAAHELAHDYAHDHFPELEPQLAEGWGEYVAVLASALYRDAGWIELVENNTDPIYGDGYRRMRGLADRHGDLAGLVEELARRGGRQAERR